MWADVEQMAIKYLEAMNVGTPITTAVPDPRPPRFVRILKVGSRRRTIVHRDDLVSVECWSSVSEEDAAAFAEAVYQLLDDWDLVPTFDGWTSGPRPEPDEETGTPVYVMQCIVRHRNEV